MTMGQLAVSGLILLAGYSIAIFAGGLCVARLLNVFKKKPPSSDPHAGMLIGWFERFLVVMFVLLGEGSAVGLIVAAKSLLRFSESREDKLFAEYVLLGTLASISIAVFVAVLVGVVMKQL